MEGKHLAEMMILLILILAPAANAEISINEIMYAPNSNWGGENNEWIELINNGSEDTPIANWTIDGKAIPDSTIPAQGYLVLAKNSTKFLEVYGRASVRVPFTLSNSGKALYLKSADNSTSDFFDYTEYATSGMAKNNNLTLERNNSAWFESATAGGTPGSENSVFSYRAPPVEDVQDLINETNNLTEETIPNATENITEEITESPPAEIIPENTTDTTQDTPSAQIQETSDPSSIEIIGAAETLKFGDYSTVRAKFKSGSASFSKVRFVAYIYKPSWITRDINGTTLRNSPYNANAAAEVLEISANETYYLVLPLFLKCNTEGYADTSYTARVRAYYFENSEWKTLIESDRDIFVSGETVACKKEKETVGKTSSSNNTIDNNCIEKITVLRDTALEINVTYPEIVFQGENFTTTVFVKNNGETLRDIEIYSYMYEHSTIISSGFDGTKWANARTSNSKKVTLGGGNSTTIELVSRARENATAEKYTYKISFDDLADDRKSEERIYLIELSARNTTETNRMFNGTNGAISNSTDAKNKITGEVLLKAADTKKLSLLDRIIYKIKSWLT